MKPITIPNRVLANWGFPENVSYISSKIGEADCSVAEFLCLTESTRFEIRGAGHVPNSKVVVDGKQCVSDKILQTLNGLWINGYVSVGVEIPAKEYIHMKLNLSGYVFKD